MIFKIPLQNILFLDIETASEKKSFFDLDDETQFLFDSKTAYQRKDEFTPDEFYDRAGIWAEFGKIICISVGFFFYKNDIRKFKVTTFFGDEKKILSDFANLINQHYTEPSKVFCGHNIKEFDIPFIARRYIINGLSLPEKLNLFGKKPWEINHLDTMELWRFGDYKNFTSLRLLSHVLGVPSPKDDIDGSEVNYVYWVENNLDRIITYCEKDVVTVAQILLRLQNQELLVTDDIMHV